MSSKADQDHDFFKTILWCRTILDDPDLVARPISWRQSDNPSAETLFSKTLNSDSAIRNCAYFYKRPRPGLAHVDEARILLNLGGDLDGHPHVCHGGIIATIMDEVMGMLLCVNQELEYPGFDGARATAYLNTTYLKAVTTPQTLMVVARIRNVEGRKLFTEASVVSGEQVVLAEAEALFIKLREPIDNVL